MDFSVRKPLRLPEYDYSKPGYYFITVCTQEKRHILGRCVGADVLIGPHMEYSFYGRSVYDVLSEMKAVDKFVVMPNHVHIIFHIYENLEDGTLGTASPTQGIPALVGYMKRQVTKKCGKSIWQRSYYDHVIRNEADYVRIWKYMDGNPATWSEDQYFWEE